MSQAPSTATGLRWFVCHTRPRCEKKFASLLDADRCEHYLPLVTSTHRYGPRTRRFTKPLFPGYVFAHVALETKRRIYQQELLVRAIPVEDENKFLRQLDNVRALVASGLELNVTPLVKRGTRVRVAGGPLWGVEGVVDDPSQPTAVVVAVDVLQQGLRVKIPIEDLEPLP